MNRILLLLFIGSSFFAYNQTTTPVVVASSGDFFEGTNASLSWTLGEIMTETYNGSSNQLTQGFQQPLDLTSSLGEDALITVSVYPNPTQANVTVEIPDNSELLQIEVYDIAGKLIFSQSYTGTGPKLISFENMADGMYFMTFKNQEGETLESLKIQKN